MHYLNLPREIFDLKNLIVFLRIFVKIVETEAKCGTKKIAPRKIVPDPNPKPTPNPNPGGNILGGNLSWGNSPVTEKCTYTYNSS